MDKCLFLEDVPVGTRFKIIEKEINVMSGTLKIYPEDVLVKLNDYNESLFCMCKKQLTNEFVYPNKLSEIKIL